MGAVLWDSSAILAVLDRTDVHHAAAREAALRLASDGAPGVITNYIHAEAHALLLRWLGRGVALQWLLEPALTVLSASVEEEAGAVAMLTRYADKNWSLCDAISFAVMEARGVRQAFAYDQHFRQWGKGRVIG